MIFNELNSDNFLLFAVKNYENPQAVTKEDFDKDLKPRLAKISLTSSAINENKLTSTIEKRIFCFIMDLPNSNSYIKTES